MNLTEIQDRAEAILTATTALAGLPILKQLAPDYNATFQRMLTEPGIGLVLWNTEGSPVGDSAEKAIIDLENALVVAVVSNAPTKSLPIDPLEAVRHVLKALHFALYKAEPSGRKTFRMGNPAYTLGPLDTNLTTYFCNFRIKSTDTINAVP
jgi:hypothetical protein